MFSHERHCFAPDASSACEGEGQPTNVSTLFAGLGGLGGVTVLL